MTKEEATQLLKKMSVVMWDKDPSDTGIVTDLGPGGFFVIWANGQSGWIDYQGAQIVSLFQPQPQAQVVEKDAGAE